MVVVVEGMWDGGGSRGGREGGRAWLAGPPAGQKGGKNGFHTRKSIRAGSGVELAAQSGRRVFKKFLIRCNF